VTTSGIGYDIHRFAEGRSLVLGGVSIPHARGLQGHSDADVLSHAVADALLGAVGERDIGHHFPDNDDSIRGISSLKILARARHLVEAQGGRINNIDVTLIAEEPRVGPYHDAIRASLALTLGLPAARVGLKATTNEGLGALGRAEGIAALAIAAVELPGPPPSPATSNPENP
jgi:2-C-methyl-D-erythritol 2,4-cyclodiphosphate synthase